MVTIDNPLYYRGDGVAVHTYFLALNLAKLGCEVHVLGLSKNLKEKKVVSKEGVFFHCFPTCARTAGKSLGFFFFLRAMAKEVLTLSRQMKFDVVHGQGSSAGAIAFAKIMGLKSRCIGTIHTVGFDEQIQTAKDYWECGFYLNGLSTIMFPPPPVIMLYGSFAYNQMDLNISVSEHNRRRASLVYRVPLNRIVAIPSAVNSEHISGEQTKFEQDGHTILYVGRLAPRKGVHYLLQAMPHVIKYFPNAKLFIVGTGPLERYLKDLSKKLGLEETTFFLGYISDLRKHELLSSADVAVVPSIFEGCPLVLLEAMGAGKPVVASAIQGISEVVENAFSGLLVSPGNIHEIKQAIILLLRNRKLARTIGDNAKQTILRDYSWEEIARRTVEVYGI